jgi:NADPH:quinone reductase-like Zn-dependent oxidoreductase
MAFLLQLVEYSFIVLECMVSRGKDQKIEIVMHQPNRRDLNELATLIENGQLQSHVDRVFPLSETANAFKYYEKGTFKGKIVIKVS